jgi:hypothetical protein
VQDQRVDHAVPKRCHRLLLDQARAHARIDQGTTAATATASIPSTASAV